MEKTTKKAGRPPVKTTPTIVDEVKEVVEQKIEMPKQQTKSIPKAPNMDELIRVISLRPNPLTYASRTQIGYELQWDEYGSEQWIEYRELINMKNSQSAFFKKNWIICDMEVLQALRVDMHYKNMIDVDNLEELFEKTVEEIKHIISISSDGVKQLIFDKALNMYKNDELDSIKIKTMLKEDFKFDIDLVL